MRKISADIKYTKYSDGKRREELYGGIVTDETVDVITGDGGIIRCNLISGFTVDGKPAPAGSAAACTPAATTDPKCIYYKFGESARLWHNLYDTFQDRVKSKEIYDLSIEVTNTAAATPPELSERIVYRSEKNRELTINEIDTNFHKVANPFDPKRKYYSQDIIYEYHDGACEWFMYYNASPRVPAAVGVSPSKYTNVQDDRWISIGGGSSPSGDGDTIHLHGELRRVLDPFSKKRIKWVWKVAFEESDGEIIAALDSGRPVVADIEYAELGYTNPQGASGDDHTSDKTPDGAAPDPSAAKGATGGDGDDGVTGKTDDVINDGGDLAPMYPDPVTEPDGAPADDGETQGNIKGATYKLYMPLVCDADRTFIRQKAEGLEFVDKGYNTPKETGAYGPQAILADRIAVFSCLFDGLFLLELYIRENEIVDTVFDVIDIIGKDGFGAVPAEGQPEFAWAAYKDFRLNKDIRFTGFTYGKANGDFVYDFSFGDVNEMPVYLDIAKSRDSFSDNWDTYIRNVALDYVDAQTGRILFEFNTDPGSGADYDALDLVIRVYMYYYLDANLNPFATFTFDIFKRMVPPHTLHIKFINSSSQPKAEVVPNGDVCVRDGGVVDFVLTGYAPWPGEAARPRFKYYLEGPMIADYSEDVTASIPVSCGEDLHIQMMGERLGPVHNDQTIAIEIY